MRERERRKEAARHKAGGVRGVDGAGAIRWTNLSAQNMESALGSGGGDIKGLPVPFLPTFLILPFPTVYPGCGWAAGPSVC